MGDSKFAGHGNLLFNGDIKAKGKNVAFLIYSLQSKPIFVAWSNENENMAGAVGTIYETTTISKPKGMINSWVVWILAVKGGQLRLHSLISKGLTSLLIYFILFLCRQYISNVGAKERYNIKELITSKNSVVPYLTEQDILEVCIFLVQSTIARSQKNTTLRHYQL